MPQSSRASGTHAAYGERRAGHDHRGHFVEQLLAHGGADVDGRRGKRDSRHAAPAFVGLEPVNRSFLRLNAPCLEFIGQHQQPIVCGQKILLLGFFAELLASELHLPGKKLKFGAEVVGDDSGLGDANGLVESEVACARGLRGVELSPCPSLEGRGNRMPVEEVGEEGVGQMAAAVDLLLLLCEIMVHEQALVRAIVVEPVQDDTRLGRW